MPIELNRESIEILEISHRMSRAAICRFRLNSIDTNGSDAGQPIDPDDSDAGFGFGDSERLPDRAEVRYTADDGTILFVGKILPSQRNIGSNSEGIEYTAADLIEYLGHNPCDEIHRHYNRNRNDSIATDYPIDFTIEQIVDSEFARIVGSPSTAEHLIEAIDWSAAEDLRDLVVYDFQTEGKTWLQILDQLRDEIPMLGYWLDPRGADRSNDIRGVTLRFYNLSPREGGSDEIEDDERVRVVLPKRDGESSNNYENVESFTFEEDISQCYDKLTIKGWGDFSERRDKLEPAWDPAANKAGVFSRPEDYPTNGAKVVYPLRKHPDTGVWQRYSDAANAWLTTAGNIWHPDRDTVDARRAYRRYKTPNKPDGSERRVANIRIESQSNATGEEQLVSVSPAIFVEALKHVWYTGSLNFTIGGNQYNGSLSDNTKIIPFTGGVENDWGDVEPDRGFYPDYPSGPGGPTSEPVPKFPLESNISAEENMILFSQPLVRETKYIFTANLDGSGWNNIVNEVVYLFWPAGVDVWAEYTQWDEFNATRENTFFNYEKHLVLYEPRFFKYTKRDGTVIRDDTAIMSEYAETLFDFLIKPRYYGGAVLDVSVLDDGAEVFNRRDGERDIFMGSPVQIENWKPRNAYTLFAPRVLIQSIELSEYDSAKRVKIGFDNPQTFIPLENTKRFRSFFENAFNNGVGGTNGGGSVGSGCGCSGGGATTRPPGGGGGSTTNSTGTNPPVTTTPGTSSSGTTATSSTSDTTSSQSTSPGGSTTTTESTTTTTSSSSASSSASSSQSTSQGTASTQTVTQDPAGNTTSTSSSTTTPAPADVYTGEPFEL